MYYKKFKKIDAIFNGMLKDGKCYDITIQRDVSGCFAYGDRSAHIIHINGDFYRLFDTRYDCIPTDKSARVEFWADWLKSEAAFISVFLKSFKSIEIDL